MKLEPSLSTLQAKIELRVLLGTQAGSRLTLNPGKYDLGIGDACAVILSGPNIEDHHAVLSFDGERAAIRPVDGKIRDTHGTELLGDFPLALGVPVEIGGIWICVDDVDADWPSPTDVVPIMPAPPKPKANEEQTQEEERAKVAETDNPKTRQRAKTVLITASVALGLLAIGAVTIAAWIIADNGSATYPENVSAPLKTALVPPPNLAKVRQILSTVNSGANLEVVVTGNRQVVVKGFVPDTASKTSLTAALELLSPPPQIQLHADSELMELASKLITGKIDPSRARLRVENVHGGILSFQGAVATQSVRDAVMDQIQAGVPGLRSISASITLADDLPQLFQEQLERTGLLKKFQILDKQPEFVMRGTLNNEEMRRWESLIVEFTDRYGPLLPIRATIKMSQSKPPVQVQAIIGGSTPFVVTENGERITRGGEVNGNKLIIVKDNEIIFDGNERFRISR